MSNLLTPNFTSYNENEPALMTAQNLPTIWALGKTGLTIY